MPNSLAANKGKPGYDEDGVRRLIVRPDGSYPTWETWKTLELWMRANGCEELDGMWSGPDADYERYDTAYRGVLARWNEVGRAADTTTVGHRERP